MIARFIATAAIALLPAAEIAAQVPPAGPAPLFAEIRKYAWTEAFPYTLPFAQWEQVSDKSSDPAVHNAKAWLYRGSVRLSRDGSYLIDTLYFVESTESGGTGYRRANIALHCTAPRVAQLFAMARVTIDPGGMIVPISEVSEIPGARYFGPQSLLDSLCNDPALRARFMTAP